MKLQEYLESEQRLLDYYKDYPDVVSIHQAAEILGTSNSSVQRAIRSNRLKHLTFRTAYRIPILWIVEFMILERKSPSQSPRLIINNEK